MVKLELRPGVGLGAFTLGLPLCEVLAHIRDNEELFPRVEIKYNEQEPLKHDLVVNLPGSGFHLRFESTSQRLRLIEVYDITRLQVQYAQSTIGGHGGPTTLVQIYTLFGPTYPGCFDSSRSLYLLHYPGLLLFFPIPPPYASCCINPHAEVPLEFPDGTTPVMSRISVYHGGGGDRNACSTAASGINAAPHMLRQVVMAVPPVLKHGAHYIETVQAELGVGLTFRGGRHVGFGATPQDVLAELGAPVGVTYKRVDTMLIHAAQGGQGGQGGEGSTGLAADGCGGDGTSRSEGQLARDYFYNYYGLGIDVLFDGLTHQVKKFVLHTNPVGHVNFNVYVKCRFVLKCGTDNEEVVHADDTWTDVQRVMGSNPGRPVVHMSGTATNPFGPTYVYGYRNAVFEVMRNGNLASVLLFKVDAACKSV